MQISPYPDQLSLAIHLRNDS